MYLYNCLSSNILAEVQLMNLQGILLLMGKAYKSQVQFKFLSSMILQMDRKHIYLSQYTVHQFHNFLILCIVEIPPHLILLIKSILYLQALKNQLRLFQTQFLF